MADNEGIFSRLNPITHATSAWDRIKIYANKNIFTLFTSIFVGVFAGSFAALFLINGAFMGLVEGIGTFCSYFFTGFFVKAFLLAGKAFIGGVLTGLSSVIIMAPFIIFGVINLAFLAALAYTGYSIWKNPGMIFNTVNAKDPSYKASESNINGVNPNNLPEFGPQDPNNNNNNNNGNNGNMQQQQQQGFNNQNNQQNSDWGQSIANGVKDFGQRLFTSAFNQNGPQQQEQQNPNQFQGNNNQQPMFNSQGIPNPHQQNFNGGNFQQPQNIHNQQPMHNQYPSQQGMMNNNNPPPYTQYPNQQGLNNYNVGFGYSQQGTQYSNNQQYDNQQQFNNNQQGYFQ